MEWIKAEIEFASTFSYRMPDTSSQFAIPMLLPGPSTIKLGLVATAILQSGKIEEGQYMFEILKRTETKFLLPERIAVFRPLIKRLKAISAAKKTRGFEPTFGTRGYVLYSAPLILYLGISDVIDKEVKQIVSMLKCLRRLGTSDSLLMVSNITRGGPPDSFLTIEPLVSLNGMERGGLIQKVKDITSEACFSDIDPFKKLVKKGKKNKSPFVTRFYILPVKSVKEGGNWILYERL